MGNIIRNCSILIATLAVATPALAQEGQGRTVSLGAGGQFRPQYPGADSYELSPFPIFDLRRRGDPLTFEAPDEGIGFGLLGRDSVIDFGPAVSLQSKRDEDDVGAAVGNVGFTIEAGAFAEIFVAQSVRLRAEVRRGLGGHDGWIGDLSADFVLRDRDTYVFSVGPRARWSDGNYHRAYFGVTPAVATTTGLAPFAPDAGFHSLGAVAGMTYQLNRSWGLYAHAGYDRLIGDAARSPIVRAFGSRDQYTAGAGVYYSFDTGSLFGR